MSRCGCASTSCSCLVAGSNGVTVSGVGSSANPYTISGPHMAVNNTSTVNLTLTGDGTAFAPYTFSADASITLDELTDVIAPTATAGQVLTYSTTPSPAWRPAPGATASPGAISVDPNTLIGDGSGGSPLSVKLDPADGIVSGPAGLSVVYPPPVGYQNFATTWYFSGAPGAIGNGYMKMRHRDVGNVCVCRFMLYFGSTTSGGNGQWSWQLPHTAANLSGGGFDDNVGPARYHQTGWMWSHGVVTIRSDVFSGARAEAWGVLNTESNSMMPLRNADTSGWTGTGVPPVPNNWSFVNGSFLTWNIEYEFV